ncbi:hypothetical protein [Oceanobacillus sp. 1P07AA]|uniref:hypothetical protein n=1 Tax=Oceanobacillus sp. 1P07AA TaxID=3132293 RepID=UPI0039A73478
MGLYYLIILFIGIILIVKAGLEAYKKGSIKQRNILFFVVGVVLVTLSIFLFTPGSSEFIADFIM